ncbi:alpha/beta hydrolase [Mesorhizobium sp. CU2]|nr:alpha/beta hydrolase [Mesorhizobium sp. CU3]TPO15906.1 alpha/beta hydrolase [Mesorhizobium sp. CU2]
MGLAVASAQSAPRDLSGSTVILVHGAFADGSSWSKVIPLLESRGLHVVAVQNPLSSLADDAAATKRAVDQQTGPVVLVGHSWGGAVITQAGDDPKVKALVYVAAFAPDEGQSINSMTKPFPPAPWTAKLKVDSGGYLTLPEEAIISDFAQDLPRAEAKVVAATQGPWAARCLDDTITVAAWKTKPSWYVLSGADHMIDPRFQAGMSANIKAKVVKLDSSHVAMLSHPKDVAKAIIAAAESIAQPAVADAQ